MLKSKRIKQLSFLLLVTVFVFVPLQLNKFFPTANIIKADESGDESDYFDNGYEYIEGNVTWGAGDHIIEKGLFIDYGGVLNIEKGARVLFRNNPDQTPYINVGNNGRIIANGTQDEKITFSSIDDGGLYYINFNTYNNSDNTYAEESFFRYVEFFGTKIKQGGGAMSVIQNLFINTANAEGFSFSNIISYGAGKIHIENSTFHNGNININTYIGKDYNKNGFVEIVNSNFELSDEGIAINSNLRCYEELSDLDCSNHVLLKNNWYGNTSGQTPFTINSLVYGKYSLDNWRTNNLITDPVVIVPGIMGSAEVLGTWKIDPILHVYDDLISSFKKNGYENNINLFEFPYNWRKSNAQTAEYLKNAIDVMKNTNYCFSILFEERKKEFHKFNLKINIEMACRLIKYYNRTVLY